MKKVKQRRIGNITPIYKGSFRKLVGDSPARTPTTRSFILLPRNPSLPKTSAEHDQKILIKSPKPNIQTEEVAPDPSAKEKAFLGKIISLKNEKNEISLASQKRKLSLRHIIEKLNAENKTLKNTICKLIPIVGEKVSPRTKTQIQELLENDKNLKTDKAIQCELVLAEQDASTGPQSSGANKDELKVSTEDFKNYRESSTENECIKEYAMFLMTKKPFINSSSKCNALPDFIKSLCISN